MTRSAFQFLEPVDIEGLRQSLAGCFGVGPQEVCIYLDVRDLAASYERRADERLWEAYASSAVRVFLAQFDPAAPGTPGWFAIETRQAEDNAFGAVARGVAARLGQTILFRDPTPEPRDSPFIEAAQIGVDAEGGETRLWLVEYHDEDGRAVTDLRRRDQV